MPADYGLDKPKNETLNAEHVAYLASIGIAPIGAVAAGAPVNPLTKFGDQCREAERVCAFLEEKGLAAQTVRELQSRMEAFRKPVIKATTPEESLLALEIGSKAMTEVTDAARRALDDANVYIRRQEQTQKRFQDAASQLSEKQVTRVRNALDNAIQSAKINLPTAIQHLDAADKLLNELLQPTPGEGQGAGGAPEQVSLLEGIGAKRRGAAAGGDQNDAMSEFQKQCNAVREAVALLNHFKLGRLIVQGLEASVGELRASITKPGNGQRAVELALETSIKAMSEIVPRAMRAMNDARTFGALQDKFLMQRQTSGLRLMDHENAALDKLFADAFEAAQVDLPKALKLLNDGLAFFESCLQSNLGQIELVGGKLASLTAALSTLRRHRSSEFFKMEIEAADEELKRLCKALLSEQAGLKGKSREPSRDSTIDQCAQRLSSSCRRIVQMADQHAHAFERDRGIGARLTAMIEAKPEGVEAVQAEWTEIQMALKAFRLFLVDRNYDLAASMLDVVEAVCARAVTQKELLIEVLRRQEEVAPCRGVAGMPSERDADALHKMLEAAKTAAENRMQAEARVLLSQVSKGCRTFRDLEHQNAQANRDAGELRGLATTDRQGAYQRSIKLYGELTAQYRVHVLPKGHLKKLNELQNLLEAFISGKGGDFDKLLEQWILEYLRASEALPRHLAYMRALEAAKKECRRDQSLESDLRLRRDIESSEKCAAEANYALAMALLDEVSQRIATAPEVNGLLSSLAELEKDAEKSIPAQMAPMLLGIKAEIATARSKIDSRDIQDAQASLNLARRLLAGAKTRLAITSSRPRAVIEQLLKTLGEMPDGNSEMDSLAASPSVKSPKEHIHTLLGARFRLAIDASAMSGEDLWQIYHALSSLPPEHVAGSPGLADNLEAMWRDPPAILGKDVGAALPNLNAQNRLKLSPPPNQARFSAMLAVGLALDRRLNFMFARQGNPEFAGWSRHSALEILELYAKQLNFNYIEELRAYVEKGVSPDKAKEPPLWGQAKAWADAVRHDRAPWDQGVMCMYKVYEGGLQFPDGRIYTQAGPMDWFSCLPGARQAGVCGRQFRSPQDWFAYLYAAFHCGLLPVGHPACRWLKELEQAPPR